MALTDQKLADMPEAELKNVLRYVFALIGIRGQNLPVDEEKEFLHQYIRKFYGTHTGAEVRMAFDMAIQNRLEVDPRAFENFSVEYFAKIMNAFRKWSAAEVRIIENKKGPTPPTPEQRAQINREYADYLVTMAYKRRTMIDKLPSTMANLKRYEKRNPKG